MTYVIAGGGTGGHVFPAIAVADAIKSLEPSADIVFIGTERGLEHIAVPKAGYKLERIVISGLKGRSVGSQLRALWQLPKAVYQSITLLRRYKAKAVLGVGGYASGPALIAAAILRIPVGLCEPNSVPGLTNRILGRVSKRVFTAFKSTAIFFSAKKICLVGNAVRNRIIAGQIRQRAAGDPLHILVLGGSQGARALNQKLPACFLALREKGLELKILHQSGLADEQSTKELYKNMGLDAQVESFIDDMSAAYASADLIICRSGATTCSEVLASGPVAIFVPLPSAIYDHQMLNAKELEEEGASLVVAQDQITPAGIANLVINLLNDPNRIITMIGRARKLAKPNAAIEIAQSFINRFSIGIILLCGTHFFMVV